MLFITYNQNSSGRSGHALCDIFTVFCFSELLNMKVIYHDTWKNQKILSKSMLLKYSYNYNDYKYDYILDIDKVIKWECLSYDIFLDIKNKILNIQKSYENVLVRLSNVCKIHPHILYDWYLKKLINTDIYTNKVLPTLKNIYYSDHNNVIVNDISIHIRCGDLNDRLIKDGFTYTYHKNIIDILNENLNVKISVYCEDINYKHLLELNNLKNTTLYIGGEYKFSEHFNEIVNSKIIIMSPSSMSLFLGYICNGLCLIDRKSCNFRPNIFNYSENVFKVFDNIQDEIETIKKYL